MTNEPHRCAILFPQRGNTPEDAEGCILPNAHHGPHEFVSNGERYQWETDMGCDCESCQTDEPDDWCIVYSKLTDKRGEP